MPKKSHTAVSNEDAAPAVNRKLSKRLREENGRERRMEKKKAKRQRQEERTKVRETMGDEAPPKETPRTIESTREYDETMVNAGDDEIIQDEVNDEMADYFNRKSTPKVLITISPFAKKETWKMCYELKKCIPNSEMYSRKNVPMKKVVKQAIAKEFTDIIVVNEDKRQPNALTLCHLPDGPTAFFKVNSYKFTSDIKRHGETTDHVPEVVLNNFNTRLGHTIGRMWASLFPHDPQFHGRRVVTMHNQRDYLFFRHHRYEFKKAGGKVALKELGPRFTLRLKALQKGTFDTKSGEYEWVLKRHEMETSRRRFFL